MATDLERLVVQLSADIKQYERGLQNAMGVTNRQARAIENRWKQSERNLNALGGSMARGLIAPLGGIAAALTAKEVLSYADAWTKAKNSLAVAGVTGATQVAVLDRLYQSAQKNSAPIGALADLFGKAAQASDNLGASNEDLLQFSDGVGTALKVAGTGAAEASGALQQLGQLLGSARVQAEEFNSVQDGARPILIAVANGLDAAGGSVNRLKQLVNDGKVSGQQFFQAFLKGLPTIQAMAANSTQTIEQGVTSVANAFTKYIGQTDESMGASQRLAAGLNALAANFEETANIVVQLASIIAGALVGRSLALMIGKLGLATTAVQAFVVAMRAAATTGGIATMLAGISAAAGPIGLVVGGTAVAALAIFSATAGKASAGAKGYAEALRQVGAAAKAATTATSGTTESLKNTTINSLTKSVQVGEVEIKAALDEINRAFASAFDAERVKDFIGLGFMSAQQEEDLEKLRDGLNSGKMSAAQAKDALFALANSNPAFQRLADGFAPLLDKLGLAGNAVERLKDQLASLRPPSFRESENASMAAYDKMASAGAQFIKDAERQAALSKDQLALEKQIAEVRTRAAKDGVQLTDKQAESVARLELAAEKRRSQEGRDSRPDDYAREAESIRKSTEAIRLETETLGQSAYAIDYARTKQELLNAAKEAGREITPALTAEIEREAAAHAKATAELDAATRKQQQVLDLQQQFGNLAEDSIFGLVDGTKDLNDVLNDTLRLLARMILQAALLGSGPLGDGGGGIIGAVSKGVGFAEGGYTGDGGKHDPAGVVHRGEYVFDKAATSRIGVRNLEAMRRGTKGYAEGGFVKGFPSSAIGVRLPKIASVGGSGAVSYSPSYTIDARGSQMNEAQFMAILEANNKRVLNQVVPLVQEARARRVRGL